MRSSSVSNEAWNRRVVQNDTEYTIDSLLQYFTPGVAAMNPRIRTIEVRYGQETYQKHEMRAAKGPCTKGLSRVASARVSWDKIQLRVLPFPAYRAVWLNNLSPVQRLSLKEDETEDRVREWFLLPWAVYRACDRVAPVHANFEAQVLSLDWNQFLNTRTGLPPWLTSRTPLVLGTKPFSAQPDLIRAKQLERVAHLHRLILYRRDQVNTAKARIAALVESAKADFNTIEKLKKKYQFTEEEIAQALEVPREAHE